MSPELSRSAEVLIVGAGPTGLVLALWLKRLGVDVRIVDKTAEPGTTSRALAVHARTLEFYEQMGLAGDVVECGLKFAAANVWVRGKLASHAAFGFCLNNPPYHYDEEERRVEHAFLKKVTPYLAPGGVLCFLLPQRRLAVSVRYAKPKASQATSPLSSRRSRIPRRLR